MLKLSTKGRYGARVMLELAAHYEQGPVLLKDIARRQDISRGYLEHIVPPLKAAGLINATRGAHGGYMLSKKPASITLDEVVSAVEGPLTPVECVDAPGICDRVEDCVTRLIWKKLGNAIHQTLQEVALSDLLEMKQHKEYVQ